MRSFLLLFGVCLALFNVNAQETLADSLLHDTLFRHYLLHIPPQYDGTAEFPLVIGLHGLTNSGEVFMNNSNFNSIADTANFIVCYPTAMQNGLGQTAWNNGLILGADADDEGFLLALIDELGSDYAIDSDRVYFTGYSMGGFMSNHMACNHADKIAAIGTHSGTISYNTLLDFDPARPFPMVHIHGTSDLVVSYDGNWLGGITSVDSLMLNWRQNAFCPNTYTITELPDTADDGYHVDKAIFGNCEDNIELWLYTVHGAGHTWLAEGYDIHASKEIWKYFQGYTLTGSVGIEEEIDRLAYAVYPNPARDFIEVSAPSGIRQMEVLNAMGELVITSRVGQRINLGLLPSGIYMVRFEDGHVERFIRQ